MKLPCFYEKLSAGRNLRLHCEYMGIYEEGRIEPALEQVGLQGCENKIVGKFSLGMKQRLGIARALLQSQSCFCWMSRSTGWIL